jgi:hypothetical protein
MSENIINNGENYDAIYVSDGAWIVHWYKKDGTIVEALLTSNADVPQPSLVDVVRQAVRQNSWG